MMRQGARVVAPINSLPNEVLNDILGRLSSEDLKQAGSVHPDWRRTPAFRQCCVENVIPRVKDILEADERMSALKADLDLVRVLKMPTDAGAKTCILTKLKGPQRVRALEVPMSLGCDLNGHFPQVVGQWSDLRRVDLSLGEPVGPMQPVAELMASLPPSVQQLSIYLDLRSKDVHPSWRNLQDCFEPLERLPCLNNFYIDVCANESANQDANQTPLAHEISEAVWLLPGWCKNLESLTVLTTGILLQSEDDCLCFTEDLASHQTLKHLSLDICGDGLGEWADTFINYLFHYLPSSVVSLTINPYVVMANFDERYMRPVNHYQNLKKFVMDDTLCISDDISLLEADINKISVLNRTVFSHLEDLTLAFQDNRRTKPEKWGPLALLDFPKRLRHLTWEIHSEMTSASSRLPDKVVPLLTANLPASLTRISINFNRSVESRIARQFAVAMRDVLLARGRQNIAVNLIDQDP